MGNVLGTDLCWEELPDCGNKYPKLPYTPIGLIYSFNKWIKDWEPVIYSDGTNYSPKDITGSVPGQTFWKKYNGPAPVWMFQRSIFRYIYSDKKIVTKNNRNYPTIFPGPIENLNLYWNKPLYL